MAGPQVQQNLVPNDPELKDLFALFRKNLLLEINCHHVATIQTFDATEQTATATIVYKKTLFVPNPVSGVYEPQLTDYPVTIDCPVICLGGGAAALTFPIAPGDECLALFNDRAIDTWFSGAANAPVGVSRYHSFSDAILLVGVRSLPKVIENYDPVRAVLRNGAAMVGVSPLLIKIANNTQNLNTLLQSLCTQLEMLTAALALLTVTGVTSGGSVSGVPANAAVIAAIGSAISTIANGLAELLE